METLLGGLAFGCLIAAQFFAVVAVHNERWESDDPRDRCKANPISIPALASNASNADTDESGHERPDQWGEATLIRLTTARAL